MEQVVLKLKQASAVLGVPPKDLQNFVQARVLRPKRRLGLFYFDTSLLLRAKVAIYLKGALGASTGYLARFADAVAALPDVETRTPAVVLLRATTSQEPPVEIRIPLGVLASELRQRLPLAAAARDLPRGRKRRGWRRDFLAAVDEASAGIAGASEKQIAGAIREYRRARRTSSLTVVAEAAQATA